LEILAALECVDAVTLLDAERPFEQLRQYRPDLYIKGGDYSEGSLRSADLVKSYGGRVVIVPSGMSVSTSEILARAELVQRHCWLTAGGGTIRGLVVLDRDGTLIEEVPYLHEPELVRLLPGVGPGLRRLQDAGLALVIVTNQQGIGLGYYGFREFVAVNRELFSLLDTFGVRIWKVYFCPHSLAVGCGCHKPETGLLERAMEEFGVRPEQCFVIGDSEADVEMARRCRCAAWRVGERGATFEDVVEQVLGVIGS